MYGDEDDETCQKDKARYSFILDNADTLIAADYMTHYGRFLYSQAIKDHFELPCSLADEDETQEMDFKDILLKIAKRDIPLSFEIWSWCFEKFLPFEMYDEFCGDDLNTDVICAIDSFPGKYKTMLVEYMSKNKRFYEDFLSAGTWVPSDMSELIVEAIKRNMTDIAYGLFESALQKTADNWKATNSFINSMVSECKDYEGLEIIEYFRDNLFPLVRKNMSGMVQDEIPTWEQEIAEYIDYIESNYEQYAYTRKNTWRLKYVDSEILDPVRYDTEELYLKAVYEEKYGWRRMYKGRNNPGLDPDEYETLEEFKEALELKNREIRKPEMQDCDDKTVYTFCGVLLPFAKNPYYFRTEDDSLKIGDTVVVRVGKDETETKGKVVSVGQYLRVGAPFPVDKAKFILRKDCNSIK